MFEPFLLNFCTPISINDISCDTSGVGVQVVLTKGCNSRPFGSNSRHEWVQ
jgi:hypothetical protein